MLLIFKNRQGLIEVKVKIIYLYLPRRAILAIPSHFNLKLLIDLTEELGLTDLANLIKEKRDIATLTIRTKEGDDSTPGDWLKLNVGGEMFETTRETLTKFPDSQLAKMVKSNKNNDALCLDLDPEYFRPVLNWLR